MIQLPKIVASSEVKTFHWGVSPMDRLAMENRDQVAMASFLHLFG